MSLTNSSGLLAPMFVAWVVLIPGYLVLLFLAIPLYVWIKKKFGITWLTVLMAGAACGAATPVIIHGIVFVDATFSGQFSSLLSIMKDGVGATAFGVTVGMATAAVFKVLVGRNI